jgi:hypothetical protein
VLPRSQKVAWYGGSGASAMPKVLPEIAYPLDGATIGAGRGCSGLFPSICGWPCPLKATATANPPATRGLVYLCMCESIYQMLRVGFGPAPFLTRTPDRSALYWRHE